MYYLILIVITIILFLLRKRIMVGTVGVFILVMITAFTIFLLDFFWLGQGFFGVERDVRNFEPTKEVVGKYDEVVKEPGKVAKEIGEKVKDKGTEVNEKLKETGSGIDSKLGISKDSKNNNLWGEDEDSEGVGEEEESESNDKQDSKKAEYKRDEEKENMVDKVKNMFSSKDEKDQKVDKSTEKENEEITEGLVKFANLGETQKLWGLSDEDFKFVKSASPFNTGKFSNGSIEIKVEDEGVLLLGGG